VSLVDSSSTSFSLHVDDPGRRSAVAVEQRLVYVGRVASSSVSTGWGQGMVTVPVWIVVAFVFASLLVVATAHVLNCRGQRCHYHCHSQ
jgi:hypothetical protein